MRRMDLLVIDKLGFNQSVSVFSDEKLTTKDRSYRTLKQKEGKTDSD